jgi:hypothetical protein
MPGSHPAAYDITAKLAPERRRVAESKNLEGVHDVHYATLWTSIGKNSKKTIAIGNQHFHQLFRFH